MAAEEPEVGYPITDTRLETASAGLTGASTLRAPLPDSPQEVRDISAQPDTAQVPDPEAFANVGASVGQTCLLYTSPSPRDRQKSRMPSSA